MIVIDDDRRTEIPPGRLAALIRWLIDHRDKFEDLEKVQLLFDCAGQQAKVSIKERLEINSALSH